MEIEMTDDEIKNAMDDDDYRIVQNRMSDKQQAELLKKLCCYCERPNCSYFCQKYCKRAFHKKCKDLVEKGAVCGLDENKIDFPIKEMTWDEEKLQQELNTYYNCVNCRTGKSAC